MPSIPPYSAEEITAAQALYASMQVRVNYKGFKDKALSLAFDRVSDPKDWRGPIDAWVDGTGLALVCTAIEFYTAVTPIVSYDTTRLQFRVTCCGYRIGPAGDH